MNKTVDSGHGAVHAALPPLPPSVPLRRIPGLMRAMRRDIVPQAHALFGQLGPTFRLAAPSMEWVFVSTAEDAERVLVTKQDIYAKGDEYEFPALGLRTGLVTSRGQRWQRDRKMINPMFAKRRLDPFAETMTQRALEMTQRWGGIADGASVDVATEMMRVTLEIAAQTLFGVRLQDDDISRVGVGIAEVLKDMLVVGTSPIPWVLNAIPGFGLRRAARTHWRAWRVAHRIGEIDEVLQRQIDDRKAHPDRPADDFLAMLLAAEDGAGQLNHREVMAQSATFIAAGHETTGTGLSWFWHLLAENPDARTRMLAEVDQVLCGRPPTAADVDQLPWTRACFNEALRIHPPVYLSMRTAFEDDVLGGYRVNAGSVVIVLSHEIHRDPALWPQPQRFEPERFMPGAGKNRPRGAYLPFGGGRRICIGAQFALMEATLIAAAVSQRYVLDSQPGWQVVEEGVTTLRPKGGLPMVLRRRHDGPLAIEQRNA